MRYDVTKFLFIGLAADKTPFFAKAQEAGIIHFIDAGVAAKAPLPPFIQELDKSIKILQKADPAVAEGKNEADKSCVAKIIALSCAIESLEEEERLLGLEIARIAIFGDFSKEDLDGIAKGGKRSLQFFSARQGSAFEGKTAESFLPDELFYVGQEHGLDYFVAVTKERHHYPHLVEMFIDRPLGDLKERLQDVQAAIKEKKAELSSYKSSCPALKRLLASEIDEHHLHAAKKCASSPLEEDRLFAVQGWVPAHRHQDLAELTASFHVDAIEVTIDAGEEVPTYLENGGLAKIGEDLVQLYDTPSKQDKDPSLWVLFSFLLFFSMIIGDGGYGLILLSFALYYRYRHQPMHGAKQRFLQLGTLLGFSCIAWGLLTTSFFGIEIAPDSSLRKVSLLHWLVEKKADYHVGKQDAVYDEWLRSYPDVAEAAGGHHFLMKAAKTSGSGALHYEAYGKFADNVLMELALIVGVIHLSIAMGRTLRRNWAHLGWIIVLAGGYLYAPHFLSASSMLHYAFGIAPSFGADYGLPLVYGGMILAVAAALYQHKLLGLIEATLIIQIFGDVLSYLRLYALGLSGALLTATMNDLAGAVPIAFGVLIWIFGHSINIVLALMGGVIHGLRLNFLEWYHYCFEGGGKLFSPLCKIDVDVNET